MTTGRINQVTIVAISGGAGGFEKPLPHAAEKAWGLTRTDATQAPPIVCDVYQNVFAFATRGARGTARLLKSRRSDTQAQRARNAVAVSYTIS